jgi:hypothetical protein
MSHQTALKPVHPTPSEVACRAWLHQNWHVARDLTLRELRMLTLRWHLVLPEVDVRPSYLQMEEAADALGINLEEGLELERVAIVKIEQASGQKFPLWEQVQEDAER